MAEYAKAINEIGGGIKQFFFDPLINAGKAMYGGKGKAIDALHAGFGGTKGNMLTFEAGGKTWSGMKIAGGLGGLGIGYRFASGGGAYRDKNGNTDIAGIPFV